MPVSARLTQSLARTLGEEAATELTLEQRFNALELRIASMKTDMILWMGISWIGTMSAVIILAAVLG